MAQRNACHPAMRPQPVVSRSERMAQLEAEGEKLGEEFNRLQDEEDAELAAAEEAELEAAEQQSAEGDPAAASSESGTGAGEETQAGVST